MSTFKQQADAAYKTKVLDQLEKVVRAVALVVDAELVRRTPVDTGRARANWLPSLNTPDTRVLDGPGGSKKGKSFVPSRDTTAEAVTQQYKLTDTIYISNNLPYIQELNNGSSQQAPAGFVDSALAKGKRAVKKK